ncbi:1-aminocyclopropane-1-carboxylate oxidase homolog 1-like [Salvia splendens]|uniref:1-aminocyclopropane-1-carboxylate oxidase homolog 1-like n=1 Tax=Salvia splendens TaxID=180675 RepID=UPI001102E074|nr:1-aminocyclopropane-1-carboxylate oxidase homolog 1-like [Salvia splendens]XP_042043605.1 1-aminocyclopropane-1-carboxylate oxidase homolog 1-like [Salvia splendens]
MADSEQYDRMKLLRDFEETKAGVKGLNDAGLFKLPQIFVRPPEELAQELKHDKADQVEVEVPVVDLSGGRREIVEQVRSAAETWGFFQVVSHGIPQSVCDGMIDGVRRFHEMDVDEKKKYYSRDARESVRYSSNFDLFNSKTAGWRDTLSISANSGSHLLHPHQLPAVCRDSTVEYSKHVEKLGNILLELLSEGLGLKPEMLREMECSKGHRLHCHYYPACPEPHLAIGTAKHSDPGFLTILLQNQLVSALQVFYKDSWIDIQPVQGALVINIGDLLQLVSNGKYRSNEHRVIANGIGPRISVACFLSGPFGNTGKIYGPIQELITQENPAIYKEIVVKDYLMKFLNSGLDSYRALDYYKA